MTGNTRLFGIAGRRAAPLDTLKAFYQRRLFLGRSTRLGPTYSAFAKASTAFQAECRRDAPPSPLPVLYSEDLEETLRRRVEIAGGTIVRGSFLSRRRQTLPFLSIRPGNEWRWWGLDVTRRQGRKVAETAALQEPPSLLFNERPPPAPPPFFYFLRPPGPRRTDAEGPCTPRRGFLAPPRGGPTPSSAVDIRLHT